MTCESDRFIDVKLGLKLPDIKARSIAISFFSYIANSKLFIWSAVNVLKTIRFCMLLGTSSVTERDSTDEQLKELSGSDHVAKTLHALSLRIAILIQSKLTSLDTHESLKVFFNGEKDTLHTFVDSMLPLIYKNLARNIKDYHRMNNEKPIPVAFADIISLICKIVDKHISAINDSLGQMKGITDEEEKNAIICQSFSKVVEDFLTIALPNGIDELPFTKIPFLSKHYWNVLQQEALPLLFYSLYNQLTLPIRENKKEILLKMSGGKSLFSLAQMATRHAVEKLSEIFLDPNENNSSSKDCQPALVVKMARGFSTLLEGSDLFKTWISHWFSKELVVFGKSDDIFLKKLWALLGGYLEPLLVHIFVSLSEMQTTQGTVKPSQDIINIMITRLLSLSRRFYSENHKQIQTRIEHLKQSRENYKEDDILLNFFKPFAEDLFCLMGLDDPSKLPLPGFLKTLITGPFKTSLPNLLLRQYVATLNIEPYDFTIMKG